MTTTTATDPAGTPLEVQTALKFRHFVQQRDPGPVLDNHDRW